MAQQRSLPAKTLLFLLALFAVLWFGTLDYRKLIKPDEGRYAEIPREMVASGDWLTPRLNGLKYFEKPALQYWATAAAFTVFGEHHWTARLWGALSGFLGVLVTWFAARRLWGKDAAQAAFEGSYQRTGEWQESPYLARAFDRYEDIADAMPPWAQLLYGDLAQHVRFGLEAGDAA